MSKNVVEMSSNFMETKEKLLPSTIEIAMEARKIQKTAKGIEDASKARSFWAGSPKCLVLFGGAGGTSVILYYVLMALIK
jgi:hypothetical protein